MKDPTEGRPTLDEYLMHFIAMSILLFSQARKAKFCNTSALRIELQIKIKQKCFLFKRLTWEYQISNLFLYQVFVTNQRLCPFRSHSGIL